MQSRGSTNLPNMCHQTPLPALTRKSGHTQCLFVLAHMQFLGAGVNLSADPELLSRLQCSAPHLPPPFTFSFVSSLCRKPVHIVSKKPSQLYAGLFMRTLHQYQLVLRFLQNFYTVHLTLFYFQRRANVLKSWRAVQNVMGLRSQGRETA